MWRLIISHDSLMNELREDVFQQISKIWSTPDIDLFASILNYQLPKYHGFPGNRTLGLLTLMLSPLHGQE